MTEQVKKDMPSVEVIRAANTAAEEEIKGWDDVRKSAIHNALLDDLTHVVFKKAQYHGVMVMAELMGRAVRYSLQKITGSSVIPGLDQPKLQEDNDPFDDGLPLPAGIKGYSTKH